MRSTEKCSTELRSVGAPGSRSRESFQRRVALGILIAAAVLLPAAAQAPPPPASHPPGASAFVVVLDPAHGGDDAGASIAGSGSNPEAEKNFTLVLSVRLRSLLAARGITVVTTRESDVALDASRRAEIANHAEAQACLSIHASMNGSGNGAENGPGVHLFISSLNPAQPARFVPWKTAQAAWISRSVALAGVLNSVLLQDGIPVTLGRTALTTVDSMTCPAVVVEVAPEKAPGATSGHASASLIDDSTYQAHIAKAIADALLEWRTADAHLGDRQP